MGKNSLQNVDLNTKLETQNLTQNLKTKHKKLNWVVDDKHATIIIPEL